MENEDTTAVDTTDAAPEGEKKARIKHKYVAVVGEYLVADKASDLRKLLADKPEGTAKVIVKGRVMVPRVKTSVTF